VSRLEYAEGAIADLRRLAAFLEEDHGGAAEEVAVLIMDALEVLRRHPLIGRPAADGRHELVISRGRTGFVAIYEFHPSMDRVLVLAIRHQREAGFEE
jgi:plasmid stabilization system protein ParE